MTVHAARRQVAPAAASGAAVPAPADPAEVTGYRAAIRAFSDVAEALGGVHDLDDLLHLVATKICELLGLKRCSVYLLDPDTGFFRGQVGHADRDIDRQVKRLVAGVEADRFTREILRTRAPVLLRDALADPRPIRSTMRAWNVRAMLGVPMLLRGEVIGILFLDNEDVPHPFTRAQQELSATFANLAAIAIGQAQLTSTLRRTIRTAAHQNRLLRRGAEVDERLTQLILDGANLREIAGAVSELTGKPCAVADAGFRCRAIAGPAGLDIAPLEALLEGRWARAATVRRALASVDGRMAVVGPAVGEGLNHRLVLAPVLARDERWGYLVMVEYGSRIGPLDRVVADRAATIIALELSAERRAAAAENDALDALASDLIRGGRDDESLERRADFLGVRLSSPHSLCLIAAPPSDGESTPTARRVREALVPAAPGLRAFTTGVAEGVVAIVELPPDVPAAEATRMAKDVASSACGRLVPGGSLSVAVSGICRRPSDYVRAYAEVGQIMRCIDTFCPGGQARVLSADDLGIGRLLLSAADREATDRLVSDVLGPLLDGGAGRGGDLLATLQVFFACSRSVRRSAAALEVHENTVRYRLARIEELTGLAVATDADAQLTIQLALLVLRLEGRLPDAPAGG
jgi:sugar diacid utilization regulator